LIIDAHVHVLPPRLRAGRTEVAAADPWFAACHAGERRIATAAELITAMDAAGVDRALCFTWPFRDPALCAESNDHLAAVQRESPQRIIGFAIVNPASPDASAELRRCARLGLRGVGELNCDAQGFSLDDSAVAAAVATSVELGMPWTLHCSEPVGHDYAGKGTTTPDRVARFADRHHELRLIGAHLGGGLPLYAHMPEMATLCKRMWFDTAAGPLLYRPSVYRALVDLCGATRLLFGSDYPLLGVERYVEAFAEAGLSETERRFVMGDAAAELLHL
jgi:predicted TIM-barrel fold metal-dependent hydrolase